MELASLRFHIKTLENVVQLNIQCIHTSSLTTNIPTYNNF